MTDRPHPRLRRTGKVLAIALPVIGLVGLSALVSLPRESSAEPPERPSLEDIAPRSMIVGGEFAHLGLTPEVFAAAGVTTQQVGLIVQVLDPDSAFGVDAFRAARTAHAEAEADYDDTAADVRAGRAKPGDLVAVVDHRDEADRCLQSCRTVRNQLFDAIESVIDEDSYAALERIIANTKLGVPLPYAAADLDETERLFLRDALTARQHATTSQTRLAPSFDAILSTLESEPEVIAATDGLIGLGLIENALSNALETTND